MKIKKILSIVAVSSTLLCSVAPMYAATVKICSGEEASRTSTSNHDGYGCKKTKVYYYTYKRNTSTGDVTTSGKHHHSEYHSSEDCTSYHYGKVASCPS